MLHWISDLASCGPALKAYVLFSQEDEIVEKVSSLMLIASQSSRIVRHTVTCRSSRTHHHHPILSFSKPQLALHPKYISISYNVDVLTGIPTTHRIPIASTLFQSPPLHPAPSPFIFSHPNPHPPSNTHNTPSGSPLNLSTRLFSQSSKSLAASR